MVAQLGLGPILGQEGRDDPDARGPGGQEAGPEAVGAVGGDGVVAGGQEGKVQALAYVRPGLGSSYTSGQVEI